MERPQTAVPTSPFTRLAEAFGEGLAVERSSRTVCWSFAGCSAVATMRQDGSVDAAFLDRPTVDLALGHPVEAVYARPSVRYGLDAAGCARMVDDIAAFFSGTREPRFAFVSIRERRRTL